MNKNPAPEPVADEYASHDDVSVKRLALQGHRAAAVELVRRGKGCESITAFLEKFLTKMERKRLSGGQFNVLDDAFEAQWQAANRDTIEVPNVSKQNLMAGWGQA